MFFPKFVNVLNAIYFNHTTKLFSNFLFLSNKMKNSEQKVDNELV